MLGHNEIAEKYLEAGIFLYPTQFYEVHCISAVKAQLAGCKMVTSDFAALAETVKTGALHTEGERWGVEDTFGDSNPLYVDAILSWNTHDVKEQVREEYNWLSVSNQWNENL